MLPDSNGAIIDYSPLYDPQGTPVRDFVTGAIRRTSVLPTRDPEDDFLHQLPPPIVLHLPSWSVEPPEIEPIESPKYDLPGEFSSEAGAVVQEPSLQAQNPEPSTSLRESPADPDVWQPTAQEPSAEDLTTTAREPLMSILAKEYERGISTLKRTFDKLRTSWHNN